MQPDAADRDGAGSPPRVADWRALAAMAAVFAGWFLLNTVSMTFGSVRQDFRFYDLAAIIEQPARLLTGIDRAQVHAAIPFGLLCLVTLAATLAPRFSRRPLARAAGCAPLVLMLACGAILYYETSRDSFAAATGASDVANAFASLANALARRTGAAVAKHIDVGAGAGAWVAALGALYLAAAAVRKGTPPAGRG
jgi:hypothetical protein